MVGSARDRPGGVLSCAETHANSILAVESGVAQEKLAFMPRTLAKEEGEERGLRRYFRDDWSVPMEVNAFMSEIAHLAVRRGKNQEHLAEEYRTITRTTGINAGNIGRHFTTDPKGTRCRRSKVVLAYQKMFNVSDSYKGLLIALSHNKPYFEIEPGTLGLGTLILIKKHLPLEADLLLLFEQGVIETAVRLMRNDKRLAVKCADQAELWAERSRAFKLSLVEAWNILVGEVTHCDAVQLEEIRMDKTAFAKWLAVAKVLRQECGFNLLLWSGKRTSEEIYVKRTLLDVWKRVKDYVDGHEWTAIQKHLQIAFAKRGLPVQDMREVLWSDDGFEWWAEAAGVVSSRDKPRSKT